MITIDHLLIDYGYTAVGVGVGLESIGLPLPGETVLIVASTYAGATQNLATPTVVLVAAVAAIIGDNLGFWLGRAFGARLIGRLTQRLGQRARHIHRVETLLDNHGGSIVVVGRFVPVARTYTSFLAGTRHMATRRFVAFNAAGAIAWASLIEFGSSALGSTIGTWGSYSLTAGIVVAALTALAWREWRPASGDRASVMSKEEQCNETPISQAR